MAFNRFSVAAKVPVLAAESIRKGKGIIEHKIKIAKTVDHHRRIGERHEARRFVTLIDALYEAGTKLVVLADAEPEQLYPAGDGAFEFERTVSRLQEMRSADYVERSNAARSQCPRSAAAS